MGFQWGHVLIYLSTPYRTSRKYIPATGYLCYGGKLDAFFTELLHQVVLPDYRIDHCNHVDSTSGKQSFFRADYSGDRGGRQEQNTMN